MKTIVLHIEDGVANTIADAIEAGIDPNRFPETAAIGSRIAQQIRETLNYEQWLEEVKRVLLEMSMPFDEWQKVWPMPFERMYEQGATPQSGASTANIFWWAEQDRAVPPELRRALGGIHH